MLQKLPAGIVPDASADFAWFAFQSNANSYCGQLTTDATSGTAYTVANAALPRVLRLTSGASGGFTITLPTTAQIISAMGPTIPGTATIATNTRRDFFVTVNTASTITIQNLGSAAI